MANAKPFGMYGARFLVRGGRQEVLEGKARSRTVVLEFPSYEAAVACYRSPEYQAAKAVRTGKGEIDLLINDGYTPGTYGAFPMSDMRLIIAGAGGRMGRTLIKAIAETPGLALAGALEGAGSPLLGQDSGVLAGCATNGITLTGGCEALIANADGMIDFTVPKATAALAALAADRR